MKILSRIKNIVFHYIRTWFNLFSTDYTASLPQGPALIIAPHPDDETIGCGATIARFCEEGRATYVIVVTDGSLSTSSSIITPRELSLIRRREALDAAKALGLPEENVFFLSFPDNKVITYLEDISNTIEAHISHLNPAIIFTPHRFDEHEDHRAIASMIEQLHKTKRTNGALILQYPIWYKTISWPYGVLRYLTSLELYKRFRHLRIQDYMQKKEEALIQYRSQFTNLTGEECWRFFSETSRRRFCSSELFIE